MGSWGSFLKRLAWISCALLGLGVAGYFGLPSGRSRDHLPRAVPSPSSACTAFDGKSVSDVLVDVCAKLKYVRTIPVGTVTHFVCPKDTSQLIGLPLERIRSIWGEPDFERREKWRDESSPILRWTYFIGSPKPGTKGGGFPELSLGFKDSSVVVSVTCALSK